MDGSLDFEAFCLRQNTSLIRLLTLYCGDRETACDLTQETLARVWLHWGRVRRMDRPDLWTKRVALNLANSHFRHGRVERARRHLLVAEPLETAPDAGRPAWRWPEPLLVRDPEGRSWQPASGLARVAWSRTP